MSGWTRAEQLALKAAGDTLVSDDDGHVWSWDFCEIPSCPNRVCTGRSDRFCWPHSASGMSLAEIITANSRVDA